MSIGASIAMTHNLARTMITTKIEVDHMAEKPHAAEPAHLVIRLANARRAVEPVKAYVAFYYLQMAYDYLLSIQCLNAASGRWVARQRNGVNYCAFPRFLSVHPSPQAIATSTLCRSKLMSIT